MTVAELKEYLAAGYTDYEFEYKGKHGSICPFNDGTGGFLAWVVYGKFTGEYSDIDELMNSPFLNGRTLTEVAAEL